MKSETKIKIVLTSATCALGMFLAWVAYESLR